MKEEYCDSIDISTGIGALGVDVSGEVTVDIPDDIPEDVSTDTLDNKESTIDSDVAIQEDIDNTDNEVINEQDLEEDFISEDTEEEETERGDDANLIKDLVDQNVTKNHLPQNGEWSDPSAEGNSDFIISDDAMVKWGRDEKDQCTGAELKQWMLDHYDTEYVTYNHKEPNFSPFIDNNIGQIQLDRMPTIRSGGSYSQAEKMAMSKLGLKSQSEVRQYMKQNDLTWHECGDRHTVIAVPTRINAAFKHTGGISIERSLESMGKTLSMQTGGTSFKLQREGNEGKTEGLSQAIETQHIKFKEAKTELFRK